MRIKFHPMPWLTLLTLICLGILISLGTWQYQRLQWKTGLLTEIDAAANAAPITDLAVAQKLYSDQAPLDFRRVSLSGSFVKPNANNGDGFALMRSSGKSMMWRFYQPFESAGKYIYVATSEFSDVDKSSPPDQTDGQKTVIGYLRLVRPASKFMPKSDPARNSWHVFNAEPEILDWAQAIDGQSIETGYYIDWVMGRTSADDLPVKKPDVRNNHLDYMLTWYSFALILIVIYFILHKKQGRLQFGNKNA